LIDPEPLKNEQQQERGHSVTRAPNINSLPLDNTLRTLTVVQQIMTEFSGAESEEARAMVIAKLVLYLMKKWPLEFIGPSKS
jgi:hypothetical protein